MKYDAPLDQTTHQAITVRPWGIKGMGVYWMSPHYDNTESIESIFGFVKRRQRADVFFMAVGLCAALTVIFWYVLGQEAIGLWVLLGTIILGIHALAYRLTEKTVDMCPLGGHYSYIVLLLDRLCVKADQGEASHTDVLTAHSMVLQLCQRRRNIRHTDMNRVEQSIHDMLQKMVILPLPAPDHDLAQKDD